MNFQSLNFKHLPNRGGHAKVVNKHKCNFAQCRATMIGKLIGRVDIAGDFFGTNEVTHQVAEQKRP